MLDVVQLIQQTYQYLQLLAYANETENIHLSHLQWRLKQDHSIPRPHMDVFNCVVLDRKDL